MVAQPMTLRQRWSALPSLNKAVILFSVFAVALAVRGSVATGARHAPTMSTVEFDLGFVFAASPQDRPLPGQAGLPPELGFPLAPLLGHVLGDDRRGRPGLPGPVERHIHQVGARGVDVAAGDVVLRLDPDPDLQAGPAHVVHHRLHGHHIPNEDRLHERHLVHGHRDHGTAAVLHGSQPSGVVNQLHDLAPMDVAQEVGVGEVHEAREGHRRGRGRLGREIPVLRTGRSLRGPRGPLGPLTGHPPYPFNRWRAMTTRWIWFVPS